MKKTFVTVRLNRHHRRFKQYKLADVISNFVVFLNLEYQLSVTQSIASYRAVLWPRPTIGPQLFWVPRFEQNKLKQNKKMNDLNAF